MFHYTKLPTLPDRGKQQGKVQLLISGFAEQDIVSVGDVIKALEILPNHHLQGLNEIIYDPDRVFQQPDEDQPPEVYTRLPNPNSKAEFIQPKRIIAVYDFDSAALFHQILYHEIGHYVFYLILDKGIKKQWVTRIYPTSNHITAYASTNASEDFAETYAAFVQHPKTLEDLPAKYQYMRDHVFNGIAYNPKRGHLDVVI